MADAPRSGSMLNVKTETLEAAVVVAPLGDIDLSGSPTLRQELRRAQMSKLPKLVVDLRGVSYMDSSGVATLVEAMQMARKSNTKLVLCNMQPRVRSIFEIARLDSVFTIVPDVSAAVA